MLLPDIEPDVLMRWVKKPHIFYEEEEDGFVEGDYQLSYTSDHLLDTATYHHVIIWKKYFSPPSSDE